MSDRCDCWNDPEHARNNTYCDTCRAEMRAAPQRYRLMTLDAYGPREIATADTPEGIGLALITIANENREAGDPAEIVGVLDSWRHRWLTSPGWLSRKQTPFAA